jgi:hypothetical protein
MPALRELHPAFVNVAPEEMVDVLVAEKSGEPLRSINLPDLSKVAAPVLHRLVDAASLTELGSLALTTHENQLTPAAAGRLPSVSSVPPTLARHPPVPAATDAAARTSDETRER